jgi:hypothetical protein
MEFLKKPSHYHHVSKNTSQGNCKVEWTAVWISARWASFTRTEQKTTTNACNFALVRLRHVLLKWTPRFYCFARNRLIAVRYLLCHVFFCIAALLNVGVWKPLFCERMCPSLAHIYIYIYILIWYRLFVTSRSTAMNGYFQDKPS